MLSDKKIDIKRRVSVVTTTGTVLIQDEGIDVGVVGTLNFVGTNIQALQDPTAGKVNVLASSTGWQLEIFDVTQDVVNTGIVTLSQIPVDGSEFVTLNGLLVHRSPSWDYQMSGQQVTFNPGHNLTAGDTIRIKYQIQT